MKYIVYLLVVASVSYLVLILYGIIFKRRETVKGKLEEIKLDFVDPQDEYVLDEPFADRVIRPAYQKITSFLGKATPHGITKALERTIAYAGSPNRMTASRLIAIMFMLALIVPAIYYMVQNLVGSYAQPGILLLLTITGFILPWYLVLVKARARQAKIQKKLPDMMDLIFVSVEAGLGFDMALKRTTEKMPGPLSDEIRRALDEMNKGRDREEALRGIYHRTGVEDLSSFITAVIQSEQLGSNISNMLRVQSTSMRQRRRQRAEQAAMKVPVKLLFPLVFFMMPALFIVILGPAVIRIIDAFSDMF